MGHPRALLHRQVARPRIVLLTILWFGIAAAQVAIGQEVGDLIEDPLDILDELNAGEKESDLDRMQYSHLSFVNTWQHVRPAQPKADDQQTYHWAMSDKYVTPLDEQAISTSIKVPKPGSYRVFLRHVLSMQQQRAVMVRILPIAKRSDDALQHEYGTVTLLDAQNGKEQEARLPIRLESELQLNTVAEQEMPVWEYWDVKLAAGDYRLELAAANKKAQVDVIFITQSKSIRPSFAITDDNTLQQMFVRFRVTEAMPRGASCQMSAGLTYHWRGRTFPSGAEMWGHDIGTTAEVEADSWSPFLNATEAVVPGPGPWSTCRVNMSKVREGKLQVQLAWYPHTAAVVHALSTTVSEGGAMFRVPNGSPLDLSTDEQPRWGIWNAEHLKAAVSEDETVANYFTWAQQAAKELGLSEDHPRPKHLLFHSGCRVSPAHREPALKMLSRLGVNWIDGLSQETVKRLGFFDDRDFKKVKEGDEIGTCVSASSVNNSPPQLADFHNYLLEQIKLQEGSLETLLGVRNLDHILCLEELPENPGRFERWLYYHSHRFRHLASIPQYAKAVRQAEAKDKHAAVYNNYSPHPVFLTGNTMNSVDWFLLCRAGAQTLGWGEDWAYEGSWALGTDRAQCVSFYAALVDCAVRKRGYPAGFYVGSNTGNSATKIFSCVAQGIDVMHLYDWGPIDGWAEGSNAWSENKDEYKSVMTATHALGPADEIIAKGEREPRRVALLYNRSHEIMNHATINLNHEWMWAFLALKSAHIPVDVILEEDLTPDQLAKYRVLYLGGLNLERRHLRVVADWVRSGGLLIGSGGAAMVDAYNNPNLDAVKLFGAQQTRAQTDSTAKRVKVTFADTTLFPTGEIPAPVDSHRYLLKPTTATPIGKYLDGPCAAATQTVHRGRTILLGFYPGYVFRDSDRTKGQAHAWLVQPILAHLGRQRVEFSDSAVEATLFELPSGIAVTLANFRPNSVKGSDQSTTLSVATDREIREVISGLRGPLPWKRVGRRIEIQTPSSADLWVDTVILR